MKKCCEGEIRGFWILRGKERKAIREICEDLRHSAEKKVELIAEMVKTKGG